MTKIHLQRRGARKQSIVPVAVVLAFVLAAIAPDLMLPVVQGAWSVLIVGIALALPLFALAAVIRQLRR
jgi:hypothetical protein